MIGNLIPLDHISKLILLLRLAKTPDLLHHVDLKILEPGKISLTNGQVLALRKVLNKESVELFLFQKDLIVGVSYHLASVLKLLLQISQKQLRCDESALLELEKPI